VSNRTDRPDPLEVARALAERPELVEALLADHTPTGTCTACSGAKIVKAPCSIRTLALLAARLTDGR